MPLPLTSLFRWREGGLALQCDRKARTNEHQKRQKEASEMNGSYYMLEQMARQIQTEKQSQALRNRRFQKARQLVRNLSR